jgi:hypothetical protein
VGEVLGLGLDPDKGRELGVPCLLERRVDDAGDVLVFGLLEKVGEGLDGGADAVMAADCK